MIRMILNLRIKIIIFSLIGIRCSTIKENYKYADEKFTVVIDKSKKERLYNTVYNSYIFYNWNFKSSKFKIYSGVCQVYENNKILTGEPERIVEGRIISKSKKGIIIVKYDTCEGCIFLKRTDGTKNRYTEKSIFLSEWDTIKIRNHFIANKKYTYGEVFSLNSPVFYD